MAKQKIDDLAVVLSASSDQLAGDLRAAAKLLDGFKKQIDKQDAGGSAMRQTSRELQNQKKAAQEATAAWRAVARAKDSSFRSAVVGGAVGGAVAVGGLVAVKAAVSTTQAAFDGLKESVNLAAELEQTSLAFEVMLGSADRAAKMLGEIRKFASETPFNTKELTDSSRKLIAYGVAADQVVPTLRMLGDVAAATSQPVGDLAYLYGTLAAQGRAYTVDINQFANRGIPIYEELAKVLGKSVAESRKLIEEGRVGFPEVVRAFKAMTEGRGRFAGLTSRQADTYGGLREQLSDAVELGKIKLGQILIEELGLKEAAKDSAKFVDNIVSHLDRIRPAVRFFGDLGRSIAQVSSELAKATVNALRFADEMIGPSFPQLKKSLKEFREWLNGGATFKLDTRAVNDFTFMMIDRTLGFFQDFLRAIKDIGEGLRDNVLVPIQKAFRSMLQTWAEAKDLIGAASPAELYAPPQAFESDKKILDRFHKMESRALVVEAELKAIPRQPGHLIKGEFVPIFGDDRKGELTRGGTGMFRPQPTPGAPTKAEYEANERRRQLLTEELSGIRDSRREFQSKFDGEASAVYRSLMRGVVPYLPSRDDIALGSNGGLQRADENIGIARRELALQHKQIDERLKTEDELAKAAAAAAKEQERAKNALAGLAGGAMFAARELMNVKAPVVEIPWAVDPAAQDAAMRAKQEFADPFGKFTKEWNALNNALLEGVLDAETFDRAAGALLNRTATDFGIGQPTQLPDGALRDTEAAARIINQSMAAGTTEKDFLKQIADVNKQQLDVAREQLRRANLPIIVELPK